MVFRRIGAVALAAMLATSLAACGDDSDDDDASLEDADNGGSGSGSASEESEDSSDADSEALADGFFGEGCGEFGEIFVALGSAIGGAFGGPDADETDEVFEQAIADAPDEIVEDMETIRDAYDEYAEALEESGVDFSDPDSFDPGDLDALEALAAAGEAFNSEDVTEASENINEFIESGCEA